MSITHAQFTIERRFSCTPAQAFSAFSDPDLKRQWHAVPAGWSDRKWELDFRVGGREVNGGTDTSGTHHAFRSRDHDIVEGERIVFAYDLLLDHQLVSVSLTTVEFHDDDGDGGTRLLFPEQGVFFDDLEDPSIREQGTGKMLDALERILVGETVR